MLDMSFDEATFSGEVPLFPLPSVVLLPGGLLPLHVFEQRFRDMVKDALSNERLIGMALLKPGYQANYDGNPAIEDHVCVGRIALEHELDDGRWNMVLVGLRRARVLHEDQSRSYRLAQVELLPDTMSADEEGESVQAQWLRSCLEDLPHTLMRDPGRLALVTRMLADEVPAALSLGAAADLAADALLLGVRDRLALLGTGDASERVAVLAQMLKRRVRELDQLQRPSGIWPPRFSKN